MKAATNDSKSTPARIKIDDRLNADQAEAFLAQIDSLTKNGVRRVIIDCGSVTYLSTPGISALVSAHCRLQKLGGSIQLAALGPRVLELFRLTRLERLFEIAPSN